LSFKWLDAALAEDSSKGKPSDEKEKSAQREVASDCFNIGRYLTTDADAIRRSWTKPAQFSGLAGLAVHLTPAAPSLCGSLAADPA